MKTTKQVKELIAVKINDRKHGISTSIWQPYANDDIDRIVIKIPKNFQDFLVLTHITPILQKNKFHVAQIMGFMENNKIWVLIIRDRRKSILASQEKA